VNRLQRARARHFGGLQRTWNRSFPARGRLSARKGRRRADDPKGERATRRQVETEGASNAQQRETCSSIESAKVQRNLPRRFRSRDRGSRRSNLKRSRCLHRMLQQGLADTTQNWSLVRMPPTTRVPAYYFLNLPLPSPRPALPRLSLPAATSRRGDMRRWPAAPKPVAQPITWIPSSLCWGGDCRGGRRRGKEGRSP